MIPEPDAPDQIHFYSTVRASTYSTNVFYLKVFHQIDFPDDSATQPSDLSRPSLPSMLAFFGLLWKTVHAISRVPHI